VCARAFPGLITAALVEAEDLDYGDVASREEYKFPSYSDFFHTLQFLLTGNTELYKWWNYRLIFPAPEDKNTSDEDRNLSKIKTLLHFNPSNTKDLRDVWVITRDLWRECARASSGKAPIPESISKKVGTLHITIKKAQNLPRCDRFGGCDSYVDLIMPGRHVKSTNVVNKTLLPDWSTTFSFHVTDLDFGKRNTSSSKSDDTHTQEALEIEGIEDDGEFQPPEGVVGLYYDQKIIMPVTQTELQGREELTFKNVIANLAKKQISGVTILHSEQTAPRSRDIFFRVHTSDMLESILMARRLSETNLQMGLLSSHLLDELRLDQVVSKHLTTAETLSRASVPLQLCLRHYQLGQVGFPNSQHHRHVL